jgi:hypothetical protein
MPPQPAGPAAENPNPGADSSSAILENISAKTDDSSMLPASLRPVFLFAFDMLMDQEYVARYAKGLIPSKVVSLPHHKLVWPYYYLPAASCLPYPLRTNREEDSIWGILYDARGSDLKNLERHLNVPGRYHKRGFVLQDRGGRRFNANAYVLTLAGSVPGEAGGPSEAYLSRLLDTARERQLPDSWLAELAALSTASLSGN